MNFSEYKEAIFKARSIPYKATSAMLMIFGRSDI